MKRNVTIFIKDIIEYMNRAEAHIQNLSFEQFVDDQKTCDAVIRCLEVIGEAAKHVPDEIKEKYRLIPWRDMAGMRDKIIHAYFEVGL